MATDPYLGSGGPSWRAHLADLASRSREKDARPNQDPMRDWTPPHTRGEVTVAPEPQVVSEVEAEDGSVVLTYDDGSRVQRWQEFDMGTERVETRYRDLPDEEG